MTPAATQQAESLQDEFAAAVLDGLAAKQKHIPCRFLYDARGSRLFEQITGLEEYYPTRIEIGLLEDNAEAIGRLAGPGRALVEFGSGSSRKTRILIDRLPALAAYVPIEISAAALKEAADDLRRAYPALSIIPVHADFNAAVALPKAARAAPGLGFFPGSTIGNFSRADAQVFLTKARGLLGEDGALLIGVDLQKDLDILLPAYDDSAGVTAAFNLNLLHRINRELDGDLDVSQFAHEATYNAGAGRIEIHIVSLAAQRITVLGQSFSLAEGERIHTENSHKYSIEGFQSLARAAGWTTVRSWTDAEALFSLHYLSAA